MLIFESAHRDAFDKYLRVSQGNGIVFAPAPGFRRFGQQQIQLCIINEAQVGDEFIIGLNSAVHRRLPDGVFASARKPFRVSMLQQNGVTPDLVHHIERVEYDFVHGILVLDCGVPCMGLTKMLPPKGPFDAGGLDSERQFDVSAAHLTATKLSSLCSAVAMTSV
jgi:hypothetical protein